MRGELFKKKNHTESIQSSNVKTANTTSDNRQPAMHKDRGTEENTEPRGRLDMLVHYEDKMELYVFLDYTCSGRSYQTLLWIIIIRNIQRNK